MIYNPTVPLKWSEGLKHDAKIWAEKLLDSCGKGMWHDPQNSDYGKIVITIHYRDIFEVNVNSLAPLFASSGENVAGE